MSLSFKDTSHRLPSQIKSKAAIGRPAPINTFLPPYFDTRQSMYQHIKHFLLRGAKRFIPSNKLAFCRGFLSLAFVIFFILSFIVKRMMFLYFRCMSKSLLISCLEQYRHGLMSINFLELVSKLFFSFQETQISQKQDISR